MRAILLAGAAPIVFLFVRRVLPSQEQARDVNPRPAPRPPTRTPAGAEVIR